MSSLKVTCDDRGRHARVTIAELVEEAGGVVERRIYTQRGAWDHGATADDGVDVTDSAVMMRDETRADHEGRERWRFGCPRCGRDVPFTSDRLRAVMEAASASGVSRLELSLIP